MFAQNDNKQMLHCGVICGIKTPRTPSPINTNLFKHLPYQTLCLFLIFYATACQTQKQPTQNDSHQAQTQLNSHEQQVIKNFQQASPSVVHITSMSLLRSRFSLSMYEREEGTGTGFIWDDQGHIVTNYHVIKQGNLAQVALSDHKTIPNDIQKVFDAKLVGIAPNRDLAVLKIIAPQAVIKALPLGSSKNLQVGQSVLAIGNPFGFDQTLTTGIISGLGREIQSVTQRTIKGVIQTDAAINPGNSGGPLLNSQGKVIGINTAIYSPSGAYAGIGFAVPIDTVKRIVPQLIKYGREIKPSLGVDLDEGRLSQRYQLPGALITKVHSGSPAEARGLKGLSWHRQGLVLGDFILEINQQPCPDAQSVYQYLDDFKAGDQVTVLIQRGLGTKAIQKEIKLRLINELEEINE